MDTNQVPLIVPLSRVHWILVIVLPLIVNYSNVNQNSVNETTDQYSFHRAERCAGTPAIRCRNFGNGEIKVVELLKIPTHLVALADSSCKFCY